MKIYLAADHAGFALKEKVKRWLEKSHYEVEDFGAFSFEPGDDYPDFIRKAAKAVSRDPQNSRAIVFGGSGQGEAMVANRHKGVRAAVLYKFNKDIIKLSREHNNANVLSIGARFISDRKAIKAVKLWFLTDFPGEECHQRRIEKID